MTTTTDRSDTADLKTKVVTAAERWCSMCHVDYDCVTGGKGIAKDRPRLEVNISGHVTALCPECAKKLRAALYEFSA